MGHESQIELWSPKLTTFCFAGFGTDRFRCQEAMKTAGRENPKRWALVPSNRAHGAVGQNNSRSIKWAAKQEKFKPKEKCFFLTSTFIELLGILQTPQRFRTKRQLWAYSGFGIETQSSADHRSVNGQLQRVKKQSSLRGLNRNCNHDLKNLFKGAAVVASSKPG